LSVNDDKELERILRDVAAEALGYQEAIDEIALLIDDRKRVIGALRREVTAQNASVSALAFRYEANRARSMGTLWWLVVVLCGLGKYVLASSSVLMVLALEFAFLANWRSLYVREVRWGKLLAIAVLAIAVFVTLY
jgi:hypothetical protein